MNAFIPEKSFDMFRVLFPAIAQKCFKWRACSDGTIEIYSDDHKMYRFEYNCKNGSWVLSGKEKVRIFLKDNKEESNGSTKPDQLGKDGDESASEGYSETV